METKKKCHNMTKPHEYKSDWELPRNKTLRNLCGLFVDLYVGVELGSNTPKERKKARKQILKFIQKDLGCNKRTAYDYIQAIECITSYRLYSVQVAVVGGKNDKKLPEEKVENE